MTAAEPANWTVRRWVGVLVLVFLAQLILIVSLGKRGPVQARSGSGPSVLKLAANPSREFLELEDPTLFALPHIQGFSGKAWLKVEGTSMTNFVWSEPEKWLGVQLEPLGAAFREFMATNRFASLEMQQTLGPELTVPEGRQMAPPMVQSSMRLTGELAARRLLTRLDLPSWPPRTNALNELDLVTNTVVQVVVNAAGRPVSATLLGRSGSEAADERAMSEARTARFAPLAGGENEAMTNPIANLTWGRMVFEWATGEAEDRGPKGEGRRSAEGGGVKAE
jgi:TonB family protein